MRLIAKLTLYQMILKRMSSFISKPNVQNVTTDYAEFSHCISLVEISVTRPSSVLGVEENHALRYADSVRPTGFPVRQAGVLNLSGIIRDIGAAQRAVIIIFFPADGNGARGFCCKGGAFCVQC